MIIATKAATAPVAGLDYRWVATFNAGKLYTSDSTTGASWTARTSSFGADDVRFVASNGINQYVAVGTTGKLATSPDGITWTQRTSSFGTSLIRCVAYGNGYWVAVGNDSKLATSTDGITWTQRTSGASSTQLQQVNYGNSVWAYSADNGEIKTTGADPTTGWTGRTSTLTENNITVDYSTLGSIWVAGCDSGTTGALASSTDGTTWTARTSAISLLAAPTDTAGLANSGSVMVYCTSDDIQSSTNGTSWTSRTSAYAAQFYTFVGIASDDLGNFVALMYDGIANDSYWQYSANGTTWTAGGLIDANAQPYSICHSSGKPAIR